jgi:hypothetical protein
VVSVAALMSGCTSPPGSPELPSESITLSGCVISDGIPQFYGPWSNEIEQAYQSSITSDLAKEILCSGSITAEHVAELNEALKSCLADVGITRVSIDEYGILKITVPSDFPESTVSSLEMACEESTGWYPVSSLYTNMYQNPNKGDVDQLIADCLVRVGLVPEGFSGADVDAEYQGEGAAFPDISDDPLFRSCWFNPLGTQ